MAGIVGRWNRTVAGVRHVLPFAVLVVIVLAAGCGKTKVTPVSPAGVAVVFVDVSRSTFGRGGVERQRYQTAFDSVIGGLPDGTIVKGDALGKDPLSDTSLPITGFLEKYGGLTSNTNAFQVKQDNKKSRTELRGEFKALLGRRPTGDSILDALNIASNVFSAYKNSQSRYLVIFSDMLENSSRFRFTDRNLRPASVRTFISREKQTGKLPDLAGVEVYAIGAGATRGSDTNPAHLDAVARFWSAYVKAAGGDMPSYHYGPALIRFP